MERILTIAIPTFNRCQVLKQTLDSFIPLLNSSVSLLVIDNCSTDGTQNVVQAAIEASPQHEIRYLRNKGNIGGGANIIRCIENAETEWVWLFGDDDEPTPNSVGAVLAKIREYPDAFSMNFETSLSINNVWEKTHRTTDIVSRNYDELLNNMLDFSNFLFISATVFNRIRAFGYLGTAYKFLHSYAAHTALTFSASRTDANFQHVFCQGLVCRWIENKRGDGWDTRTVDLAIQNLVFLTPIATERSKLSSKITYSIYDFRWLHKQKIETQEDYCSLVQDVFHCCFMKACVEGKTIEFGYVLLAKAVTARFPWINFTLGLLERFLMVFVRLKRRVFRAISSASLNH